MGARVAVCASMATNGMSVRDLDTGLIRAVGMTPANVAEATVTEAITADLRAQQATLTNCISIGPI